MNPNKDMARGFMLEAAALAEKGKGATAPNPCVGAVLVKDGRVVAKGWHEFYGGPHAEVNCLADARKKGVNPAECTLYVTLEPCNHQGKTPPCAKAILDAKIPKVVIGALDPNNSVDGGGAEALANAGVEVVTGVAERECRDLIRDFKVWNETRRPYVYLKLASTLDGSIASRTGHSRWITGEEARAEVHRLRARCGAVIVGGATLRSDNPRLDARDVIPRRGAACRAHSGDTDLVASQKQPLAVVVTSRLPAAAEEFTLLVERAQQTIFMTTAEAAISDKAKALIGLGCRVWGLPEAMGGGLDLAPGLEKLRADEGVHYSLCEGGGSLALSFVGQGLMDEFWHFIAPKILGDRDAKPMFYGRAPRTMDEAVRLRLMSHRRIGGDMLCIYAPLGEADK